MQRWTQPKIAPHTPILAVISIDFTVAELIAGEKQYGRGTNATSDIGTELSHLVQQENHNLWLFYMSYSFVLVDASNVILSASYVSGLVRLMSRCDTSIWRELNIELEHANKENVCSMLSKIASSRLLKFHWGHH